MAAKLPDRTDLTLLGKRHNLHYRTLRRAFIHGPTSVRGKARERCRAAMEEWEQICIKDARLAAEQPGRAA
jgi:hypothetical protein